MQVIRSAVARTVYECLCYVQRTLVQISGYSKLSKLRKLIFMNIINSFQIIYKISQCRAKKKIC